jgi:hypothetical protein
MYAAEMHEPFARHQLVERGGADFEPQLEFAAMKDGHLFTIQEGSQFAAWELDAKLTPSKCGSLTLPSTFPSARMHHDLVGGRLVLWRSRSSSRTRCEDGGTVSEPANKEVPGQLIVIDARRPAEPVIDAIIDVPGLDACVAAGEQLFFAIDKGGYQVCPIPTTNKLPPLTVAVEGDARDRKCGIVVREHIYWGGRDSMDVMRIARPELTASLKTKGARPRPVRISDDVIALVEEGNSRDLAIPAVTLVDIASQKPEKRKETFHKKQTPMAWCTAGDTLFVAMQSSKKLRRRKGSDPDDEQFSTFLSVIDAKRGAEARRIELPFIQSYLGTGSEEVLWLGVRDETLGVLQRSGTLSCFAI